MKVIGFLKPTKIRLLALLSATVVVSSVFYFILGYSHAQSWQIAAELERSAIINAWTGSKMPARLSIFVANVGSRFSKGDYGIGYAPWNAMMAMGFFASALENFNNTHPNDAEFKGKALENLRWMANEIDASTGSVAKYGIENGDVPGGAIYQANLLRIHKALKSFDTPTERRFRTLSEQALGYLKNATGSTLPSYPGYGWHVDNAEIYAAFADSSNASGRGFADAISRWTTDMASNVGESGLPNAETFSRGSEPNQVRWSAAGWTLGVLKDVDPKRFETWFPIFYDRFYASFGPFGGVRDVPRGETAVNTVFDGPHLGPISTSATILSVPAFVLAGKRTEAQALLLTFDTLFYAPPPDSEPRWCGGCSLLLDSIRIWAESAIVKR